MDNYNGIFVIDKPAGMTSHDVVARVRRILGQRKVGHGGTLDPMATGVLPVFAGRSTRAADFVQSGGKTYVAGMRLGITTDTQDTTGTVLIQRPVTCSRGHVEAILEGFRGDILQIPPMYSALHVNGQRLYKLARAGVEVEREARSVRIDDLRFTAQIAPNEYELEVSCSKGLYVRTLVADVGEALGCGAAMSSLRRTRAGIFAIEDAVTVEELQIFADKEALGDKIICTDVLFSYLPALELDTSDAGALKNGRTVRYLPFGKFRLYCDGVFLGPGRSSEGMLRLEKSFY